MSKLTENSTVSFSFLFSLAAIVVTVFTTCSGKSYDTDFREQVLQRLTAIETKIENLTTHNKE